ncbi:MAG: alpha/beta hydrolase [Salinicola sp.]|uniref:alpha/beta hydrolase n=1 Tax=Salinicola sp. TaxID=1978524 RepID=UPI001DAF334B|nr:alpha/beta hydrolase [Salinicola sp.]NRB55986.1 alpha/beta hydrolase [Salinicola sp.]
MNQNATLTTFSHPALASQSWFIDSDTAGVQLYLRNRRRTHIEAFGSERTVMLMHAATYAGDSLFDVAHGETGSFMDFLAMRGYDVYSVDVRGYGGSTRPPEMMAPSDASPPTVSTETAISDLSRAISHVIERNGLSQLNLIGMSWGGTVAGAYAARVPEHVHKLGLIAPQWIDSRSVSIDTGGELGAYRTVSREAARERWLGAVPDEQREALVPRELVEKWEQITFGADDANPYHVPNGVVQDRRDYWAAGRAYYDPGEITAPTLLIHGEWDRDVPLDTNQAYFRRLTGAAYKRWIEIGQTTHMLILERQRHQAFDGIAAFLDEVLTEN